LDGRKPGKFRALALASTFWRPGEDFLGRILEGVRGRVRNGDIIVVSEKALSTALGNIVDEGRVRPGLSARLIAKYWMRWVWGYLLGPLCRLRRETLQRIREYPTVEGASHKQVVLRYAGALHALSCLSEGGIDVSNLPYAYACLPLRREVALKVVEAIRSRIEAELGRRVAVMIVDSDKTYSILNFHFTSRPTHVPGIHCLWLLAYLIGRAFRLRMRSTPVAVSGLRMGLEDILNVATLADRVRGFGAGRTVWEMAERFGVRVDEVTWEMLEGVTHRPIVLVRAAHKPHR